MPVSTGLQRPVWVYDNWAAQSNGMSDDALFFTEELAFRELEQILRYRRAGVEFEYYMLNFGWYDDAGGGYRRWRTEDWPDGPDRWLAACAANDVLVGLWIGGNTLWRGEMPVEWVDSLAEDLEGQWPPFRAFSMFEGGFLPHLMETLQHWYDRGVRVFEIDNSNFNAGTAAARATLSGAEIRRRNRDAFADAIARFRERNPEVTIVGFNGFGNADLDAWQEQLAFASTARPLPQGGMVDPGWLNTFDTLYCGDIRVSDVPMMSFWRSVDLYGDHMVRRYEQSGIPLPRIDAFCTLSTTFFGYHRRDTAWRSMLLISLARGGWKKSIYGNLELLDDEDVAWFARAGRLFAPLLETATFGGIPGDAEPYGFVSTSEGDGIATLVNPSQEFREIELPAIAVTGERRVLFRDAGPEPGIEGGTVRLGPEQLAVVGFGRYATAAHDLGTEPDVVVPHGIREIDTEVAETEGGVDVTVRAPRAADLRIVVVREGEDGIPRKGAPPVLEVEQRESEVALRALSREKATPEGDWFGGMSWQVGELSADAVDPDHPLVIRCRTGEADPGRLAVRVFAVTYS